MTELHRKLNVPMDQPLPAEKLREAQRSPNAQVRGLANLTSGLQKRAKTKNA